MIIKHHDPVGSGFNYRIPGLRWRLEQHVILFLLEFVLDVSSLAAVACVVGRLIESVDLTRGPHFGERWRGDTLGTRYRAPFSLRGRAELFAVQSGYLVLVVTWRLNAVPGCAQVFFEDVRVSGVELVVIGRLP